MSELKRLNEEFEKLIKIISKRTKVTPELKALLYFAFINGYNQGGAREGIIA